MWRNIKNCLTLFILLWGALAMNVAGAKQAVWIDTDPACGHAKTDDVDDCWALLLALRSEELVIRGISTLFGNGSGEKSYRTAKELMNRFAHKDITPGIHRGADEAIDISDPKMNGASRALANALAKEPLTLIALGPLTNIASLILNHPEQAANIKQVIAIAGQRPEPGLGFYPGNSRLLHLHDLNFRKDVTAFDVVLRSAVPVTLVPYEVAEKISIQSKDLAILNEGEPQAQWLAKISKPWLDFWQTSLQADGFYPFDSLAVGLLTMPNLFACEKIPAKIEHKQTLFVASRDNLLVSHDFSEKRFVSYCHDIYQTFKHKLIERLS
jgi:inosine-uridine nucleoside N-ribohydrolase